MRSEERFLCHGRADPRDRVLEPAGDPIDPAVRVLLQTRSDADAGARNVDIAGSDVESARRVRVRTVLAVESSTCVLATKRLQVVRSTRDVEQTG